MKRRTLLLSLFLLLLPAGLDAQAKATWRAATMEELQAALPDRAPVEKERIETEMRTASGVISSRGRIVAGVVLITAGYSADGKYSHYLLVQSSLAIGDFVLSPGTYVFGWKRVDAGLNVHFFDATTGAERGSVIARQLPPGARVEAFRMWPPSDKSFLQLGRFEIPYSLRD